MLDQMRDPVREHASLARTRASHDQQWPTVVQYRRTLLGVETLQQRLIGVVGGGQIGHTPSLSRGCDGPSAVGRRGQRIYGRSTMIPVSLTVKQGDSWNVEAR